MIGAKYRYDMVLQIIHRLNRNQNVKHRITKIQQIRKKPNLIKYKLIKPKPNN